MARAFENNGPWPSSEKLTVTVVHFCATRKQLLKMAFCAAKIARIAVMKLGIILRRDILRPADDGICRALCLAGPVF